MAGSNDDIVEVKFSSMFPWMLIVFGGIFLCLIVFEMAVPGKYPFGLKVELPVIAASVAAIFGGHYWLGHLPVMLRFRPEGLEILSRKMTIRWDDIADVAVQTVYVKGQVNYLCIRLRREAKSRYGFGDDGFIAKAAKALIGDYDLIMNDQEYGMGAEQLRKEIEKRMG